MEAFWTGYMQLELPVVISGMLRSCDTRGLGIGPMEVPEDTQMF